MSKDDNKNAGWFISFDSSINLEHVADFTVDGPYCFRPLTQKHLMRSNGSQAWPAASWQRPNPINQSEWANPPWTTNTGRCWPVCMHLRQSSKSVSRSIKNISPTYKPSATSRVSLSSNSSFHCLWQLSTPGQSHLIHRSTLCTPQSTLSAGPCLASLRGNLKGYNKTIHGKTRLPDTVVKPTWPF